jgi:hypothetical protein
MVGKELSTDQSILLKNLPKASNEILFLLRTGIHFFILDELGRKFGKIVTVKWSDKRGVVFSQDFGKI